MKTTQMTSKVLVAALLLSVVSPVVAAPEFVTKAWDKTKAAAQATKKFFSPVHSTEAEQKYALEARGLIAPDVKAMDANIADLKAHLAEVKADATLTDEFKSVEEGRLEALIKNAEDAKAAKQSEKSFFKKNVSDRFETLNIKHPNFVKYGIMSAVAAAITAAGAVAYKYELPQRAYNWVKSFFSKSVLEKIVATTNDIAAGKPVKEELVTLVESRAFHTEVEKGVATEAVTKAVNTLKTKIQDFGTKVATHKSAPTQVTQTDLDNAKNAVLEAVKAVKAELSKKQEEKNDSKTSDSNTTTTEETTKKETKPVVTPAPVKQQVPATIMGQARTTRR